MPRDFLSGLINRAFERTPVLQKRRRALFEPAPEDAGNGMGWIDSTEERIADRSPETNAPQNSLPPSEGRQPGAAPSRLQEDNADLSRRPGAPPPVAPPLRQSDEMRTAEPPAVSKAASAIEPRVPPAPPPQRISERLVETRESVIQQREIHTERIIKPQPVTEDRSHPPQRIATPIRQDAPPAGVRNPTSHEVTQQRSELKPPTIIRQLPPPEPRRSTPRTKAAEMQPAPQALPTIQVTIGRIELRGTQPTASSPSETPRPRAPKLGLDAYLRQRNGGSL
jgi:hypothetical protein